MKLFELPFASGTALDRTGGSAALQKYRQHLRRELFSQGIGLMTGEGRVQVENVAMLSCLETARRWDRALAEKLSAAYRAEGLAALFRSRSYKRSLALTRAAVQAAVAEPHGPPGVVVARVVGQLVLGHEVVRQVAEQMHEINQAVIRRVKQIEQFPGRLVRVENGEALVVLHTGERDELRLVDAAFLRDLGIEASGEPFVVQQLRWSPDATASLFLPAIDVDEEGDEALEAELAAATTPLPRLEPLPSLARAGVAAEPELAT